MAGVGQGQQSLIIRDCSWIPGKFENAHPGSFDCSSDPTDRDPNGGYNCIAWAAGKKDAWWWPSKEDPAGAFWPNGLPRETEGQETIGNFIKAFESEGYLICCDGRFCNGIEKVAIFVDENNTPTHACRSLPNRKWTSKMGNAEDIEHESPSTLEGKFYGKASVFLRRRFDRKPFLLQRIKSLLGF